MSDNKKDQIPEDLQKSLVSVFKKYLKEDNEIYKSQIRNWKKNHEFWSGVQYLFWSASDETWRSPADVGWNEDFTDEELDEIGSFYDYVVNIFRGHGEGIISALSAQIPSLRFVPDDADDSDDVLTAKTYDKVSDLIQRHNKAKLMALRSFFFLFLDGIVGSYIYKDSDFNYGSFTVPQFDIQNTEVMMCPDCKYEFPPDTFIEGVEAPETECPNCKNIIQPTCEKVQKPIQVDDKVLPKSRVKIDIYGALQLKVRITARNQEETPYLISMSDVGKDIAIEAYPDLEEDINSDHISDYDRFPRTDHTFPSDPEVENKNLITIYKIWMRPCAFNLETDKEKRKKLQKLYPKGCRVEIVGKNNKFAFSAEEELDKKWRIGQAGLSLFLHSDPMCQPLVSIQEMRNTLENLTMETIEHGIPSTFADPRVVNFDQYGKFEAVPGYIYKTLPGRPNGSIGEAFYETGRATVSKEVFLFGKQLDQDAQFATGAFPSVLGQPQQRDRATAKEYEQSRMVALQRLMIAWQLFVDWYKSTLENAVRLYIQNIVEDEKFVQKDKSGNYINIWIRQSELKGEVGGVESEADQNFPQSIGQIQGALFRLMEMNNQFINTALYTPENAREIQDTLAIPNFKLPGETQRTKQIYEIKELTKSQPLGENISSVPIEPDIDDDAVHAETCRAHLVDITGIDLKLNNPAGYMNIFFHMKQHLANIALQTMKQTNTPPGVPDKTAQIGVEQ